MRDELEHFVVSHVRLHLAIADRDRFLLTSIGVRSTGGDARELLRRSCDEFKPEQVKHYLAREVIAGCQRRSDRPVAIRRPVATRATTRRDDDDYHELLAELRSDEPGHARRTR